MADVVARAASSEESLSNTPPQGAHSESSSSI